MTEPRGLAAAIVAHAAAKSDAPALICDQAAVSGRDLAAGIENAARLVRHAVHVVEMRNDAGSIMSFLGGVRAGRASAVFDPGWPRKMRDELLGALETDPVPTGAEDPGADFYIGFTSGSTGTPKGFRRSAQSWIDSFDAANRAFGIGAGDTVVALGNLIHSLFMFGVLHGLYVGARTRMLATFRPDRALQILGEEKSAVVYATPTHLQLLAAEAAKRGAALPGVSCVLSAGAPLAGVSGEGLKRLFPNARVFDFYGASELSFVTYATLGRTPPGSVGKPFPGVDIGILDSEGNACPAGETGHIFVASPFAFSGYVNAADDTLRRNGKAISIGDMGYLDEAGNLFLSGRADRMIVSAARNVHPEHIEAVLNANPSVAASAVVGIDDSTLGKRLVAAVVPKSGAELTRAKLSRWCRERLVAGEVPSRFVGLPDLPMTAAGKPDLNAVAMAVTDGRGEDLA